MQKLSVLITISFISTPIYLRAGILKRGEEVMNVSFGALPEPLLHPPYTPYDVFLQDKNFLSPPPPPLDTKVNELCNHLFEHMEQQCSSPTTTDEQKKMGAQTHSTQLVFFRLNATQRKAGGSPSFHK